MKPCVFALVVLSLVCAPLSPQVAQPLKLLVKPTAIQVFQPSSSTVWMVGKSIAVRWAPLGPASKERVCIHLVPARSTLLKTRQSLLARDVRDTGSWGGVLGTFAAGRYRVVLTRGKQSGTSPEFQVLKAPPKPDLVGAVNGVSTSTSAAGDFMGWHVTITVTNLNHATAPIASGATLWWRIESQADPSKFFDVLLTGYELAQLHSTGTIQFIWNLAEGVVMPQPWKLTIDSKHHIAESNEANNVSVYD